MSNEETSTFTNQILYNKDNYIAKNGSGNNFILFKEETIFEKNILGKSYLSHRIIDSFMWILLLFCISVWPKMVTNQHLKSTCVCLYWAVQDFVCGESNK